uniref:SUEL-type lectin domain-containing protein n=2 Tax=Ciona intestinalis TaxID=7719 RepID=F6YER6_CIOIN
MTLIDRFCSFLLCIALLNPVSARYLSICEGGRTTVTCLPGYVIDIREAFYGRDNQHTCPSGTIHTTTCRASTSETLIRGKCQGRNSCSLLASNSVFGDSCRGTFKYIYLEYQCKENVNSGVRTATICENSQSTISCEQGSTINVLDSFYGRIDRTTCPSGNTYTTSCKAVHSPIYIRGLCQSRKTCTIRATNSVFGDPCYGTYKYVQIKYVCN